MDTLSIALIIGLLIGFIFVIIMLKFANNDSKIKTQYDERQQQLRNKSYIVPYWVLCSLIIVLFIFNSVPFIYNNFAILSIVAILISLTILCIQSIINGSYWGLNNNKKKYYCVFLVVGILNLICSIDTIINERLLVDGKLMPGVLNLLCFFFIVIVCIVLFLDPNNKNSEDDDGED